MRKLLLALLLVLLAMPAEAQTQCVTNAIAGGTANTITIPLLPCGLATNILLLTLAGANTSPTVTIQMTGFAALPVLNADGSALAVGALPGADAVVQLTSTGSQWLLLSNGTQQANADAFIAPQGASNLILYTLTPQIFGALGNGSTNDRAAFAAADAAAATLGPIYVAGGTFAIASSISLSHSYNFAAGGKLKPANGVVIAFTGPVDAGMYQICDLSAGGICDFTAAKIAATFPEWLGVVGGDASFSSGNATVNGPLIDSLLQYGSFEIDWRAPGIYSTLCHQISYPHKHEGAGVDFTPGATGIINGIVGSGCLATDHVHLGTDISATAKYVFQSGPIIAGHRGPTYFNNISVGVSDPTTTIPVGVLWSTIASNQWQVNFSNCGLTGLYGLHFAWANGNKVDNCNINGRLGAVAETLPTSSTNVQKVWIDKSLLAQTQQASGTCFFQDDEGFGVHGLAGNSLTNSSIEGCFNGFILDSESQEMNNLYQERFSGTVASECSTCASYWEYPSFGSGVTGTDLVGELSTRSSVVFGAPQTFFASGANVQILSGTGDPEGARVASPGSIFLRQGGSTSTSFYVKETGTGNTGWVAK